MRLKKKQKRRTFESCQHGALISQRGTTGETDERTELKALEEEETTVVRDDCFSLCKEGKSTAGIKEGLFEFHKKNNLSCKASAVY